MGFAWAPEVAAAVKIIEAHVPAKGSTYPGHEPDMAHAADFMCAKAVGDMGSRWCVANQAQLGLQYVIWEQHIWNVSRANEGWRLMADRGSRTANHFDHFHVSWPIGGPGGNGAAVSGVGQGLPDPLEGVTKAFEALSKAAGFITDPHNWLRMVEFFAGLLLILIGLFTLDNVKSAANTVQSTATQVAGSVA